MKKSLIALIVAGSFVLAGCSSSGGSDVNDRDIDPEWGVTPPVDESPDWGVDTTPDWGVDTPPQRPQPDFGETPDWGVVPPAVQPPIDNTPEWGVKPPLDRPEPVDPDFGITPDDTPDRLPPTWGGACGSPDDGANCAPIPPKPPVVDPEWGVTPPEATPAINTIDRNKVRDAVRSRLNG